LSNTAARARLQEIIRDRSFGYGEITLASGRKSNFYFNLKPTMCDPEGAALLAELTYEALKDDKLDYVGGLEMGAVPLAGALAQLSWMKGAPIGAFFVRKKPKEHGARLAIEGLTKTESLKGKRVVIVEDVTTTGGSAVKALDAVREAGAEVALVFTMVDRDEGATETSPRPVCHFVRFTRRPNSSKVDHLGPPRETDTVSRERQALASFPQPRALHHHSEPRP
jgi:orotate phosphoribosyltransferase